MDEQLSTATVMADRKRERAVDDNDGVYATIAPIREDLVTGDGDILMTFRYVVWDPLAKVCRFGEKVKGFGREADDSEGVDTASVRRHEYEIVGGGAIPIEISLN